MGNLTAIVIGLYLRDGNCSPMTSTSSQMGGVNRTL